ncbi:acetate--CoA ligase family protein [Amycolatopsis pithecellobii]|uniref:acetate--CoA ligase family protein n=1 Tax=Amycolatopsis pithecellobii TaxID=664692 RepID=UPI00140D10CE|nr:acetate--CoA ligase family protein [Amycolatopsis pithecellobii]
MDTLAAIQSILAPRSVVVIGASPHGRGFTSAPLKNLRRHGFDGPLYAVNPRHTDIDGIPCYPDVASLPEVPDTAVLVVGARRVPRALADCAAAGIKTATAVAGGFSELGEEGARLEAEIRALCRDSGLRLVGPNTAGLMNIADGYVPRAGLNHPDELTRGGLAVVTQSGALCNTLMLRILARGLGLTYAVATGSQWDLDLWDFVDHYTHDERTRATLTIVEGLKDPEKFLRTARRAAAAGKPVILCKPGRSELGRQAVQTHSGALSGAADVQVSLMRENGVIVVDELDELWETGQLFDRWRRPAVPPRALGISTYSGGDGAIAVDAADAAGLTCPPPAPATVDTLAGLFQLARPGNPFDLTGEVIDKPELIAPATAALLADPTFDLHLMAVPAWSGHFAKWTVGSALEEVAKRPDLPVAVSLWSAGETTAEAERLVLDAGVPLFDGSQRAVRAMGRYADFFAEADRWAGMPVRRHVGVTPGAGDPPVVHDYWSSRALLHDAGVPFNEARLVEDPQAAAAAADELGYPVTLKLSAVDIVHKAAAGAVRLYLRDRTAVFEAARDMLTRSPGARIVVETFTPSVAMALLGGQRDPEFGPIVVAGLGGGYAEPYRDVTHVRCPAEPGEVARALGRTTFGRMLGASTERFAQMVDVIAVASWWFAEHPEVDSFDINPVLLGLDGRIVAVDARVTTTQTRQRINDDQEDARVRTSAHRDV